MNDNNKASPLSHLIRDPVLLFFVILVSAGLALFILFPLYRILSYSVTSDTGGVSLKAAVEVLTSQTYLRTFGNSFCWAGLPPPSPQSWGMCSPTR